MRRRPAYRIAGISPEAYCPEARCHRRRSAAAGAGGDAIERVGVAGVAGHERVHRLEGRPREFRHVRFGQHERAGLAQLAHLESIAQRDRSLQRQRSGRGRHIDRVIIVLHDHRHAMQRTAEPGLREFGIERIRSRQGVGVDHDDGVEHRTLAVIGLDTIEIHLDQLRAARMSAIVASWVQINRNAPASAGTTASSSRNSARPTRRTGSLYIFFPHCSVTRARWRVIAPMDLILRRPRSSRGRLEGWPRARSRLRPSFETPARARSSGRGRWMKSI